MVRQTMTMKRRPAHLRSPSKADRPDGTATDNGQRTTDRRRGFTLVELLMVIVVISLLLALLLSAINGALRTARNAAVSSEINLLAQALEQFKSKYGTYPPSRVYLMENGNYSAATLGTGSPSVSTLDPTSPGGTSDITVAQLASRTLAAFRQIWPSVQLSTTTAVFGTNSTVWYDFNGNGLFDNNTPYVLRGHECLAFFLGGVPLFDAGTGSYTYTGFGKDPKNPFSNMIVPSATNPSPMYNANRNSPIFEFNASRLFPDPANVNIPGTQVPLNVPAFYDTLNSGPPIPGSGLINFYTYFSAYGNGNYDPNDVNFAESDGAGNSPISLHYYVPFPLSGSAGTFNVATSPSPNPYSNTLTGPTPNQPPKTVTYQKPQTYQIVSSGTDGVYGLGGQYIQSTQSTTVSLPFDPNNSVNTSDSSIRQREYDNLTNFKSGKLQ
jgi:general secretion pathway protein G